MKGKYRVVQPLKAHCIGGGIKYGLFSVKQRGVLLLRAPGRDAIPHVKGTGMLVGKLELIKTLNETNLGVAQALLDP